QGLATVGGVAWAMVLLVAVLVPAVRGGARAAAVCVPLAAAVAAPTLVAIGGWNRKSLAAIVGTLSGVVAASLLSVAFVHAMHLTGLEADFGPYEHMDNRLWFATGLRRVDFGSLLVAGMLLAGLGAVMDVSMAVASTVAEVRRAVPGASGGRLFRPGLAAGRDIIGVMVFTLALVFVGGELMFFVSVGQTGWAERWLLLANYEELAAELVRVAAAGLGMAVCVPVSAGAAALLHRGSEKGTP
ncbi:MAG: YibE/F family protein, partial [bacterium]